MQAGDSPSTPRRGWHHAENRLDLSLHEGVRRRRAEQGERRGVGERSGAHGAPGICGARQTIRGTVHGRSTHLIPPRRRGCATPARGGFNTMSRTGSSRTGVEDDDNITKKLILGECDCAVTHHKKQGDIYIADLPAHPRAE